MIEIRQKETVIVEDLKEYLGCEVVMANQSVPAPDYPYCSYTITTPFVENNGTYGVYDDGYNRKEFQQIWSFTIQSDNDTESKMLAIKAHDFFSEVGLTILNDNEIAVQGVGTITCRDNFLSVGYEYRNGFDVTFAFMNEIKSEEAVTESIESVAVGNTQIDVQDDEAIIAELTKERDRLLAEVENLTIRIDEASERLQARLEGEYENS